MLKAFLLEHRAEIKEMFLEDFNEESFRREMREEGYDDGCEDTRKEIAVKMLKKSGMPISFIAEFSLLPEDTIRELAAELELNTET